MLSDLISNMGVLMCGTLYPAYQSFKAVRTKNVTEYVIWMMYWIVFALFMAITNVSDIFLSWFPFYYELKLMILIWLLPSTTNGSAFVYRRIVHPLLVRKESEIDALLFQMKEQGFQVMTNMATKVYKMSSEFVMDLVNRSVGPMMHMERRQLAGTVREEESQLALVAESEEPLCPIEQECRMSLTVKRVPPATTSKPTGRSRSKASSTKIPRANSKGRSAKTRSVSYDPDYDVNSNEY